MIFRNITAIRLYDLWYNGIPNQEIKPFRYFNAQNDLTEVKCRKALSEAKTIVSKLVTYLPYNILTLNINDKALIKAYEDLVNQIKEKDNSSSRDYFTMNYRSLYTILCKHKLIKTNHAV